MTTTSQKRRAYRGPVLFSHGFRVFFLAAGIWALLAMALWLMILARGWELPTRLSPGAWHRHETLFGYALAVLAGFLLTAVPNWTGRLPVIGWPTAGLAALWLLGRLTVLGSDFVPAWLAFLGAMLFSSALLALVGREVVSGRNWRNLKVVAALAVITLAEALFLAGEFLGMGSEGFGLRLGAAAIVWMISLVGGRVVPSFTRNWLMRQGGGRLPAPYGRFDSLVMVVATLALSVWVVAPHGSMGAIFAAVAGGLHLWRLARWAGWRAFGEPLVWILHMAYLFVPVGFFMLALGHWGMGASGPGAVPHGWSAGAILLMTLAMMTRASLGHSGRMLTATPVVIALYVVALLTSLTRIAAEFAGNPMWLLDLSAGLWLLTFTLYLAGFWPILSRPREHAG
ncbi:MAG: NnrS family protein [Paracoccaceae bacterium]